jgi:hypothetical protein
MTLHTKSPGRRVAPLLLIALALAAPAAGQAVKAAKPTKALPATTTEVKAEPRAAAPDSMMAAMMKLAAPGPEHAALRAMEGTWKAVVKSYNAPAEPAISEGLSENRMILGGRYLEQRFQSTMMDQPFEGYGLTGYDNATHRYTYLWVDNMSTSMMTGGGTMDETGKMLTTTATMPGPDGKPADVKMVTKIVDANTHVFSMYGVMGGKEQLMMEITYTRK